MHVRLLLAIAFLASLSAAPALAAGLFVSSVDTDNVLRFDATTGAFVGLFVPAGSGGLDNPGGLAFGPDGNLYISGADRIRRYDALTGAFIDDFVAAGSGGLSGGRYFVFAADVAVPEPSLALLFLAAVAGLGFRLNMRVVSAAPATRKTCASRSSAPATRS